MLLGNRTRIFNHDSKILNIQIKRLIDSFHECFINRILIVMTFSSLFYTSFIMENVRLYDTFTMVHFLLLLKLCKVYR